MKNTQFIQLILEETRANNVSKVSYDEDLLEWVVTYKNDFPENRFNYFSELYDFLLNG